ncbi:microtubule-associated protein futsch-like [Hetaerina americana]|uniref:microtubule-associated protein futsch-like n=1 Tax=Hetaerina americana TaxID=62018 RepID=UPI003A7F4E23
MSDSDDTDVLLLIPPDFFFVAPSPSPASSPSTLSPPPISRSTFKQDRPLTEELARKSLKHITSKLKVIDRRLSLIECQHTDSMDGDRSSNWYELESNASGSTRSRARETMENNPDRRSMNVQELIQASVGDPNSVMQRKSGPLAQSWGPRDRDYFPTHRTRSSSGRRDGASLARVAQHGREVSSDEEREEIRERRSSSLPPIPASHHHPKKIGMYSEPMVLQTNSSSQRGVIQHAWSGGATTSRPDGELERNCRGRGADELDRRTSATISLNHKAERCDGAHKSGNGGLEHSSRKKDEEKCSGYPQGGTEWVGRRVSCEEKTDWDQGLSLAAEEDESFNASNLDGTLGVSAILPSLSSLGMGTSALQGSLDVTKESRVSTGGGSQSVCGGLSLSEVERLLEDMQQTQAEMERSMRRGMMNLRRRSGEGESTGSRGDRSIGEVATRVELGSGDHPGMVGRDCKDSLGEIKDVDSCKEGIVREEVRKREEWIMEGKNKVSPHQSKSSPVKIVVDGPSKKSQPKEKIDGDVPGCAMQQPANGGLMEGQLKRNGSTIYRSKSDDSLSGGQGKSSQEKARGKYLGVDLSDDSLYSSGPITSRNLTRLGDTLGSVPDLGLGVREMFAKPEKSREAVKEPPFVKKNMTLLGSSYKNSMETPEVVSKRDELTEVASFGKLLREENSFVHPQGGPRDAASQDFPLGHHNKERVSQSCGQGNAVGVNSVGVNRSHVDLNEHQMTCITPQKYLYSPQSLVENRENSGRDARRQMQFEELKRREQESHSLPRGNSASSRPPVWDGGEDGDQKKGGKVSDSVPTDVDHAACFGIPNSMGPVMVVGGEGRRRKRRMEGGSNDDGDGWKGEDRSTQPDSRQRRSDGVRVGRNQEGRWWSRGPGLGEERGGPGDDGKGKWTTRESGHRSLDSQLGTGGRFKDSAFHSGGRQNFQRDPTGGGHGFLTDSGMWVPPLAMGVTAAEEIISLRRKLEEERFRREHCERVIEEVGRRALEAQERLAVSQGLSKAKDVALGKFREAWEEAVGGWRREGEMRLSLEEEVDRYRSRVDAEFAYRDQRQKQLEAELVQLGAESSSLREELRKGQRETADMTARLSTLLESATKEVTACRKESESASIREARAQDALAKAEDIAKEAKKKLAEATKRADIMESEKDMMKQELETLQGKLRDNNSRMATLETRMADAEVAVDKARQNEKKACDDQLLAQEELDKERVKLKEFYQSQVEELVKSKVNEFQGQLDAIELSLRNEAETREEQAKKQGEERLKLLSQKNCQEVNLLEQKHEEELALWSLRLKRAVGEIENLRAQVSRHNAQKSHLAKGFRALMQAQFKQGLHLIASGGGGEGIGNESIPSPPKRLEKKLSPMETSLRDIMASLSYNDNSDIVPEKDLIPKKDTDHDLGYLSMIQEKTEKEATSSSNKSSAPNSDLKKYIHMLLDREPGKPVNWTGIGSDSDEDIENQRTEAKHRHEIEAKEISKSLGIAESEKMGLKERKGARKAKRKESESLSKQSRDAQFHTMWEPMTFKLSDPCSSGQVYESDKCEPYGQRSRKPPWK